MSPVPPYYENWISAILQEVIGILIALKSELSKALTSEYSRGVPEVSRNHDYIFGTAIAETRSSFQSVRLTNSDR